MREKIIGIAVATAGVVSAVAYWNASRPEGDPPGGTNPTPRATRPQTLAEPGHANPAMPADAGPAAGEPNIPAPSGPEARAAMPPHGEVHPAIRRKWQGESGGSPSLERLAPEERAAMTWEDHEAYARDLDDWARGHREELPEDVRHERLLRESEGAGPSPPGAGPGPVPSGPAASGADGSAPPPPAGDQPPPPGPKEANTPELRKKWLGGGDEPPSIRNLTPQEQANLTPLQYQEFLQDALNWARSHPGKEPEGWPEALLMPPSPRSGPTPDDPEHPRPPDGGPR